MSSPDLAAALEAETQLHAELEAIKKQPVPTEVRCPTCNVVHVDQEEWATTRIHRKHLCHACGHVWQPYPGPTIGCDFHVECRNEIAKLKQQVDKLTRELNTAGFSAG